MPAISAADLFRPLGPVPTGDALAELRTAVGAGSVKIIAVDDDPTGTQTVSGAGLITAWEDSDIDWLLNRPDDIGFVLTNSRSLPEAEAVAINRTVGRRLQDGAHRLGFRLLVVSRSDSTLRGHFPAETNALIDGLDHRDIRGTIVAPFFAEGGRITVNGEHYVRDAADHYVPAAETPFAQDVSFGFSTSNLREWVAEKTGGAVRADEVGLVDIDLIRRGGIAEVAEYLSLLPAGAVCAVDAVEYPDLAVVLAGARRAEQDDGGRWMYRSAASVVPTLAGLSPAPVVTPPHRRGEGGGLVIVGSHVPLSSQQLAVLREQPGVESLEADVSLLADPAAATQAVSDLAERTSASLAAGVTTVVFTSRRLITTTGADGESTPVNETDDGAGAGDSAEADDALAISRRVADGLVAMVKALSVPPRFLVAKGGITSHTVAVDGLGARRAAVLGPIIPGVPMWELGPDTRFPGLPYVVFPGNVGTDQSLADVVNRLQADNDQDRNQGQDSEQADE